MVSYGALDHGYRWQVDSALNHMVFCKEPWRKFKSTRCDDCLETIYIHNVSHSGIGDKTVQVMVWFDVPNCRMVPLHCELV